MKKSLLLASMAALALSAGAQAQDPTTYPVKDGLQLTSKWLMSVGDGTNGVATDKWTELTNVMANPGKATLATMAGGKVYIACSQNWVPMVDENGQAYNGLDAYGHLVVLDAETGAFIKDLPLTIDGEPLYDLLCANSVGTDDAGNVWICGYKQPLYDSATGKVKTLDLYAVNTETGALTLINQFSVEGPDAEMCAGLRVDYVDVAGNILDLENTGAAFIAVPNEKTSLLTWTFYPGADEWDGNDAGYLIVDAGETEPSGQGEWSYSPQAAFLPVDGEIDSFPFVWVDGHNERPALYDASGEQAEMVSSLKAHLGDLPTETNPEAGPWAEFIPDREPNGMLQFNFMDEPYLVYALTFPNDTKVGGNMALVKLDQNAGLDDATPLWIAPNGPGKLGIRKGEGRFSHAFAVSPEYTDVNGKKGIDIMLYKDMNGVGVYTLAEEGFIPGNAGVNDIEIDNSNAPVEYFNLQGVRMQGQLAPGLYISRQGTSVSKVIVK